MASLNQINLIGNLGKNPELRFIGDPQKAVCDFSIAVNRKIKVRGEWEEKVLWFKIVVWEKMAENCSQYLAKGDPVFITGEFDVEEWQDNEGNNRTSLKVTARNVVFLKAKEDGGQNSNSSKAIVTDDEVPF